MKREEVHDRLQRAFDILIPIRGNLEGDFSLETTMALGELTGIAFRAKDLMERDMKKKPHERSRA